MTVRTVALALAVALALGAAIGVALATVSPPPEVSVSPAPSLAGSPAPSASPAPSPTASPRPTPTPAPTPPPTPAPVAAPLSGRPVTAPVANQHVIAVMVDDHGDARPQSGFNAASVVWHAPAEGGIPRYMLLFQEQMPASVGPVRSVRQYYIAWAAEWRSMLVHVGGSPQALRTLRTEGQGELVYDADEFRWGPTYLWRIRQRFAPHNVYSDGKHLRRLAERLGAADGPILGAWRFAPGAPLAGRPDGARIHVPYRYNVVDYAYDRAANRYVRSVTGASPQVDAADGEVVAPQNVVVLFVDFRPLDDGHPEKQRLEAQVIGTGRALIASNGVTVEGRWAKDALDAPTRLLDAAGRPVTLAIGQTFVQVVPVGTEVTVRSGGSIARPPLGQPAR